MKKIIAALYGLKFSDSATAYAISMAKHGNAHNVKKMKLARLTVIKIIHMLIWLFFNAVIFYLLYAVLVNKIDKWIWIGFSLFIAEGVVLLLYKMNCPLTIIARKYSTSTKDNFDIYLPNWLAKYNKIIYTSLLAVIIIILVYRLMANNT